jgi:hypothetical protein
MPTHEEKIKIRNKELDIKISDISVINDSVYDDISKAYYGGAVDVYKTYGRNIHRYDVNSLYPYSMLSNDMPVGNPFYLEGDIELSELFGFVYVDIETPTNLNVPILLKKINLSTTAPLGK